MTHRTFDLSAWLQTCQDACASFGRAQQEGFRALERLARFHYAVAGDCLEAGLAQTRAALSDKTALGTLGLADLIARQAELGTQLSEKLRARAQEFSTLAAEVQESVVGFTGDAAKRAAGAKRAA